MNISTVFFCSSLGIIFTTWGPVSQSLFSMTNDKTSDKSADNQSEARISVAYNKICHLSLMTSFVKRPLVYTLEQKPLLFLPMQSTCSYQSKTPRCFIIILSHYPRNERALSCGIMADKYPTFLVGLVSVCSV